MFYIFDSIFPSYDLMFCLFVVLYPISVIYMLIVGIGAKNDIKNYKLICTECGKNTNYRFDIINLFLFWKKIRIKCSQCGENRVLSDNELSNYDEIHKKRRNLFLSSIIVLGCIAFDKLVEAIAKWVDYDNIEAYAVFQREMYVVYAGEFLFAAAYAFMQYYNCKKAAVYDIYINAQ